MTPERKARAVVDALRGFEIDDKVTSDYLAGPHTVKAFDYCEGEELIGAVGVDGFYQWIQPEFLTHVD